MSRCFPFPPPGYEKKAITDDVDLLNQEKHTEKKHKKEKKDKEKREHKDKKERDKSDGKHRDKKDRKERSKEKKKEKKKEKEKEKEKEKTSTSQEKKISAQVDSCNEDHDEKEVKDQNITSNEKKHSTPFCGHIGSKPVEKFNAGTLDKFVLDLCNRINDEGNESASQSMERSPFTGQTNHDQMVRNENGIVLMEKEKKKDTRVDDIRKMEGQGVRVSAAVSTTRPSTLVQNIVGKEKIESKGSNISEGFRNRAEEIPRISASSLVHNIVGKEKIQNGVNTSAGVYSRVEESSRLSERSIEPRDKNHKREDENKRGSKRKDKDKEKKSHGKDKERDKEKKKGEKVKEKNAQKIKDDNIKNGLVVNQNIKLPPLVPGGNKTLIVGPNMKLPQLVPGGDKSLAVDGNLKKRKDIVANGFLHGGDKSPAVDRNLKKRKDIEANGFFYGGDKSPVVDGNIKKRKDTEANGFLHETNFVPNKKPRPTPHPSLENGRKSEPCQTPVQHIPDRKVLPPNNEHNINGKIEAQSLSISLKKPSSSPSSSRTNDQIARVPLVKPRHLDTTDQIAQSPTVKARHPNAIHQIAQPPVVMPRPTDQIAQSPVVKPCYPNTTDQIVQASVVKPPLPPSSSRTKADQNSQAPVVKPPHPDTTYLSEVLSVPKIEESYDFDDDEWLFSSKDKVSLSAEASETPRVWDKAVQIDTADVCALPYVIPY